MTRCLLALLLVGLLAAAAPPPQACPVPDELALTDAVLPRVQAAARARHKVVILAIGGASTSGAPAAGEEYSIPARLAARLQAAMPDIAVSFTIRAAPRRSARGMVERLGRDITEVKPDLVVWGVGGAEAGRHVDIESFAATLQRGIETAHAGGADMVLMDLLYAPSVARMIDLTPYRDATTAAAAAAGVPVIDRHDLMRHWSETGLLDLDVTAPAAREAMARRLFDCFAAIIADGVVAAIHRP